MENARRNKEIAEHFLIKIGDESGVQRDRYHDGQQTPEGIAAMELENQAPP
jgi:hypothetical protein